jgi:hypothetical protein
LKNHSKERTFVVFKKRIMENIEKLNHYDIFEVIDTFKIEKIRNCTTLKNWLDVSGSLNPYENQFMEQAREQLDLKWNEWNEEELKMHFISLVFFIAQIEVPKHLSIFYERKLSGKVNDVIISLIVDCMLANSTFSGRPKLPYFFLQEFKQSLGDGHDPEGQMLAAMILAQELNQDKQPLYGCWLQGKFWNFTTLIGKEYCISKTYDATNIDDLHQIVFILRKLKELILNR